MNWFWKCECGELVNVGTCDKCGYSPSAEIPPSSDGQVDLLVRLIDEFIGELRSKQYALHKKEKPTLVDTGLDLAYGVCADKLTKILKEA